MNECMNCRELNIMEEIEQLDMDEKTKERILDKAQRILETEERMNKALIHCHDRIYQLERALIEVSVQLGALREQQLIEHGCN